MKPNPIVFIHIPKTAGTSVFKSIQQKYAAKSLRTDYNKPMAYSPKVRQLRCVSASYLTKNIQQPIVYGHFLAGKYANYTKQSFQKREGWRYITFFRDPLQRALSHYYFWQELVEPKHKIWRQFKRENWTLERFLLGKEFANFHAAFLWKFPIAHLDFVGLTEKLDESLHLLGQVVPELGHLTVLIENQNPNKQVNNEYLIDPELARQFKKVNAEDYALYEQALTKFEQQKQIFVPV